MCKTPPSHCGGHFQRGSWKFFGVTVTVDGATEPAERRGGKVEESVLLPNVFVAQFN